MFVSKNREIKKRNNSAIETIRLFILKIIEDYNIKLQYHDIIGVFLYDSELSPVLIVYGIMKLTQMVPKIDAAKSELSLL